MSTIVDMLLSKNEKLLNNLNRSLELYNSRHEYAYQTDGYVDECLKYSQQLWKNTYPIIKDLFDDENYNEILSKMNEDYIVIDRQLRNRITYYPTMDIASFDSCVKDDERGARITTQREVTSFKALFEKLIEKLKKDDRYFKLE